jgi:hypothetical protein
MRSAAAAAVVAAASLPVTLCGCDRTLRVEIGARRSAAGDIVARLGVSVGIGLSPDNGKFSVTQSVGYRYVAPRSHSATTTTRLLVRTGPVYASGAFDIDNGGFDLATAIGVPIQRSGDADAWDETRVFSAGFQVRVGRHDDETTTGADVVIGYDTLGGRSGAFGP